MPNLLFFGCLSELGFTSGPGSVQLLSLSCCSKADELCRRCPPGAFAFFSTARHNHPAFHSLSLVPGYFLPLWVHKVKPSFAGLLQVFEVNFAHLSHGNIVAIEISMKGSLILKQSLQTVRASQLRGLCFQEKKRKGNKLAFESKSS